MQQYTPPANYVVHSMPSFMAWTATPKLAMRAKRIFECINAHNMQQAAKLIGDGSVQDPLLEMPAIGEQAILNHLNDLSKAFPDFQINIKKKALGAAFMSASIELKGTNKGPIPGRLGIVEVSPTNHKMCIEGSATVEIDRHGQLHLKLNFSLEEFTQALFFQSVVLPIDVPEGQFGAWYRRPGAFKGEPGAASITWLISHDPAEFAGDLPHFVTGIVDHFCASPGCAGVTAGMTTRPNELGHGWAFTMALWENVEATDVILKDPMHQEAVRRFMKEGTAWATHSRVFTLDRAKPVMVACDRCGKKNNAYKKVHKCSACEQPLPPPPPYW